MPHPEPPHRQSGPGAGTDVLVLTSPQTPELPNIERLRGWVSVRSTFADGLAAALPGAQVLVLWDFFSGALAEAWPAAKQLEWIHVAAAGVNAMLFDELAGSHVVVTNARGIFDGPISEYVAGAVLAHDKGFGAARLQQIDHSWRHFETHTAAGRRVLVVGTGSIGRACVRVLSALGMDVRAMGRTARHDPQMGEVYDSTQLADVVGGFDHVVLVAPLTGQTQGMVDAAVLAAMRPGAHLINVGRGALVDEPALVAALQTGTISATLDVFGTEPLPPTSPLWDLPNVLVTPHNSGDTIGWRTRLADQFEHHLRLFLAGEPLPDPVDTRLGFVPGA